MLDILDAIATAKTVEELFECCDKRVAYAYGLYHHIPTIGSQDYGHLNRFWSTGLSDEVIRYLETKRLTPDPVMQYVFAKGRPFWLSAMLEQSDFKTGREHYRANLVLSDVGDGLLIPVFGPFLKQGYIFVGFENSRKFYDDVFAWQMQAILQAVHTRYCTIVESFRQRISLTTRESEVLELLTFGKTNPQIGLILGISANTVSGHVKRIFIKFNASDRVTVALRARSSIFNGLGSGKIPKNVHSNAV
jgi:LuxR family transcriptional regulator/LuxR family quorum-sensing system transcriptional regulator CciR